MGRGTRVNEETPLSIVEVWSRWPHKNVLHFGVFVS